MTKMILLGDQQKKPVVLNNLEKIKVASELSLQKAGSMLHIHQCARIQVKLASISSCREEVLVEVTSVSIESHIKILIPISRILMYRTKFSLYALESAIRLLN